MIDSKKTLRMFHALALGGALIFPLTGVAADLDKGRAEIAQMLDGIFNNHFRRITRVRAALHECALDKQADSLKASATEKARAMADLAKQVHASESSDLKAYVDSIGSDKRPNDTLHALYSAARYTYIRGVFDGASGALIWVDEDDKKKLCEYMLSEAEEFMKLRQAQ